MLAQYGRCLQHPVYLPMWIAEVVKLLGNWFTTIAMISQLNALSGTPSMYVGIFLLCRRLPYLFTFAITGTAADAFNRGSIMAASCVLQGCISIAYVFAGKQDHLWVLFALVVLQTALQSFYDPARAAAIPTLFPASVAHVAATLDTFCWCFTAVLGGLLGGMAASQFGPAACFMFDAGCFMAGALFILRLIVADAKRLEGARATAIGAVAAASGTSAGACVQALKSGGQAADLRAPLLQALDEGDVECSATAAAAMQQCKAGDAPVLAPSPVAAAATMRQGCQYLLSQPNRDVLILICAKASGALLWGCVDVYNSRLAQQPAFHALGDASLTFGILLCVTGAGCVLGPLLANALLKPVPTMWRASVAFTFLLMGVGLVMLAYAANIWVLMMSALVRSFGSNTLWTHSTAILQLRVPDRVLGRVFATEFMLYTLSEGGSAFVAGWALDRWGIPLRHCCLALSAAAAVMWALWAAYAHWLRHQQVIQVPRMVMLHDEDAALDTSVC